MCRIFHDFLHFPSIFTIFSLMPSLRTMQCASLARTCKALNLVFIDRSGCLSVSWRGKNWHKQIWEQLWLTFYRNLKITLQLFIQLTLEQHGFKLRESIYTWVLKNKCVLQYCMTWGWLNLWMQNCGYGGPTVKLHTDFQWGVEEGVVLSPLTAMFKGQL